MVLSLPKLSQRRCIYLLEYLCASRSTLFGGYHYIDPGLLSVLFPMRFEEYIVGILFMPIPVLLRHLHLPESLPLRGVHCRGLFPA